MVQRRENLRLALEARDPFMILRERRGKHLDRNVTIELAVAGAIRLTHPAGAEGRDDFVRSETCARTEVQGCGATLSRCVRRGRHFTGTFALSSSNQLRMTLMEPRSLPPAASAPDDSARVKTNWRPSGVMS